jgi:hypothetical protein
LIEFFADNEKFGSSLTGGNGLASTLYVPGKKGSVQLRVSYNGKGNFAGTEWSGTLPVKGIHTALTLLVQGFAVQGDNIVVKATIKDSSGNPMRSAMLSFTVVAGNRRVDQTLMTDSEGSASLLFNVVSTNTIKVDVVYPGDLRYDESQATATVLVFNPLLLSAIVAAIIGGSILGIFGFMRFKLKLDPLTLIREGFERLLLSTGQTKPAVSQVARDGLEHCTTCGAPMSDWETSCRMCGSRREGLEGQPDLLEKVYSYIVEHSGVISLREAASELGVTPEQVKQATERLKRQGRLE